MEQYIHIGQPLRRASVKQILEALKAKTAHDPQPRSLKAARKDNPMVEMAIDIGYFLDNSRDQ